MTTNITVPEKGSVKSKVLYLMDNYPELTRVEMAELLGKSLGSIYSQVHLINKERKEGKLPPPAPVKQAVEMPVQVEEPPGPPESYQYSIIEEDHAILDALLLQEPPPLEPLPPLPPFETVAPMATATSKAKDTDFSKIPETLDLSLTGISGGHLKTLLTQLLNNSLSDSAEYSFVLSVERKKI